MSPLNKNLPPPETASIDESLLRQAFAAMRKTFRGEIWEDDIDVPMGKGYSNDGKPFNIEEAFYLKEVMRKIKDSEIRKLVCRSAVQTLKTFGTIEKPASYFIKHDPGDMVIYVCDLDAASDHSKSRLMPFLRSIPGISMQVSQAEEQSRHSITQTEFHLPGMTLRVWPLNESSTQRMTLRYVFISDAFQSKRSGMIGQAIARATQHPHDKKIIIESQGSEEGDDFDLQFQSTNQQMLHVLCPYCETNQPFLWGIMHETLRPVDFKPVTPKRFTLKYSELEIGWEPPKPGTYSGMIRGDKKYTREKGQIIAHAVKNETYYECYHCGAHWIDEPDTRLRLDKSSNYIAANPSALPENQGFSWPFWINQRLRWGADEYGMLAYLYARKAHEELGNIEPYKQWIQKRAALTWMEDLTLKAPERLAACLYDEKAKIPGELARISATDFQLNGTHMIYQAWAIGDGVPMRLLHYEWVKPPLDLSTDLEKREWCKNRVRALDKEFNIERQNSMKDCAHRPDLVREWAAEDHVVVRVQVGRRLQEKIITYGLLIGDDRASYTWTHPGRKPTLERFKQKETVYVDMVKDGRRVKIPVQHRLWSNPSIKAIAVRWRDGDGAPKIEVHEKFLRESGKESFWAQMNSERLVPWKGRPGKFKFDNEGRPNHAWDGFCMVIERMDEVNLLNHFGPPPEEKEDSPETGG